MSCIAGASTINDGDPLDEPELGDGGAGEGVRDRDQDSDDAEPDGADDEYGEVGVGGSWRCLESLYCLCGDKGSVGGRLIAVLPGERFGDGAGDGSYIGGGTKLAITRRLLSPPPVEP